MPAPITTDDFLALLRNSQLLAEDQISDYLERTPDLPSEPQSAARRLAEDGLLSTYQSEQLLAGRYKGFFLLGGQYKVIKPIGKGGMGTVFLCEQLKLNRFVAIKI